MDLLRSRERRLTISSPVWVFLPNVHHHHRTPPSVWALCVCPGEVWWGWWRQGIRFEPCRTEPIGGEAERTKKWTVGKKLKNIMCWWRQVFVQSTYTICKINKKGSSTNTAKTRFDQRQQSLTSDGLQFGIWCIIWLPVPTSSEGWFENGLERVSPSGIMYVHPVLPSCVSSPPACRYCVG